MAAPSGYIQSQYDGQYYDVDNEVFFANVVSFKINNGSEITMVGDVLGYGYGSSQIYDMTTNPYTINGNYTINPEDAIYLTFSDNTDNISGYDDGGYDFTGTLNNGEYYAAYMHFPNNDPIYFCNATQQGGGTSLSVTYGGNTIINSSSAGAWTLTCANKYMSTNVVITASGITGRTLTCTYGGNAILSTGNDGTYTLTCGSKKAGTAIEITLTGIMVSFTIATHSGDLSCQADQGMTWEQWCNSSYNEHGFYVSGTHIVDSPETWVTNTNSASDYVLKTDTIQDNHTYTLQLNN